jgi:hypothetical protein
MTQEQKNLLLKDLCGRLPYGVICEDRYGNILELTGIDKPNTITLKCSDKTFWTTDLDGCKPYLFPMSSMTEEQKKEYALVMSGNNLSYSHLLGMSAEDWFNKNHLDYRGLIDKGLAIDATNLNIY